MTATLYDAGPTSCATIRPETRDPERYQCLRCGIWRVKKSGRSTRYCIDCLSVEPTLRRPS